MPETTDIQRIKEDLVYHANELCWKLKWVAIDQDDPAKLKAAITRANKFLQDMHKYEVGDD